MQRTPPRSEGGFTLVECLVAMAVGVIILTAGFRLFEDDSRTYHSQVQIAEMRQNARSVMEMMSRDLLSAGYGMVNPAGNVPVLICNEPSITDVFSATAVTLHSNAKELESALSADMAQDSGRLKVTSYAGLAAGMRFVIWDNTGTYQWATLTLVQAGDHLEHDVADLGYAYTVANGGTISVMDEITYRYNTATRQVERMVNAGAYIPVAEEVTSFKLRYFKGDLTEVTPDNNGDRSAIRKIRIELKVRTAQRDRRTGRYNEYTISTEVAPRNLPYLAG